MNANVHIKGSFVAFFLFLFIAVLVFSRQEATWHLPSIGVLAKGGF